LRRDDTAAAPLPSDLLRAHPGLPPFTGLTADSRAVGPGFLFAALPGAKADGRAFIADAVARGAAAVLAPDGTDWPEGIPARPLLTVADPRRMLALFAAEFHAAQPATVVAVTGTNGKTSTVDFLRQIWRLDGLRAASLGTLGLVADGMAPGPSLTTPDPVALHAMLAALSQAGVTHAAMEASSHGIDQRRLDGVGLAAAGFSNLTRDHLDYHGTMEAYRAAKLRLFDTLLPAGAAAVSVSERSWLNMSAASVPLRSTGRVVVRTSLDVTASS
jgi:UDP-N-acetylmuramoyl-L-alanyl-D-glutamate--2,6-diaminopimelate ligase